MTDPAGFCGPTKIDMVTSAAIDLSVPLRRDT
jgi:hypothetical protein